MLNYQRVKRSFDPSPYGFLMTGVGNHGDELDTTG